MKKNESHNNNWYARHYIGQARDLMIKARQKELKPYHITPQQGVILAFLYNLGHKATLSELSSHTGKGPNTISPQMTALERDGLVNKERAVPKSTLLSFDLTDKGREICQYTMKVKSVDAIMSVLGEDECKELISMLKMIIKRAKKYN